MIEGGWRREEASDPSASLVPISAIGGTNYRTSAKDVREDLMDYYNNEGQVPWQMAQVLSSRM